MREREKSTVVACTAVGTYNLYTCPKNCRTKVVLVFITNANGNNTVTLSWYRKAEDTSYFIIGAKNMIQGEYIQLSDSYLVLEPEDRLDITITNVGIVDGICTAEELFLGNTTNA